MAIMIPSVISPEVKSSAERKIFEWFQNAPGTDKWIVLHSLGITTHNKVIYGETDFLVLAPQLGVFALEVKGGRVKRENGIWYFTNRYGKTNSKVRGPFEQAKDGMLRAEITGRVRRDLISHRESLPFFHLHPCRMRVLGAAFGKSRAAPVNIPLPVCRR